MHARHAKDKNQAPGQLSPAGESNKNAEPNNPTRVGQKVRQELRWQIDKGVIQNWPGPFRSGDRG
jgi:hypothetical protein